mgnify:CR=1 FL=1
MYKRQGKITIPLIIIFQRADSSERDFLINTFKKIERTKEDFGKTLELIKKYKKKATGQLRRYLITPEQEFVEAACLIAIVEKKDIPSDTKLAVMPESYVLGLLDCVGELKRRVFDEMRIGNIDEAIRFFEIMEGLYLQLYTFSLYDKVVKEARRKIDVNRILVDDVRSAITEEKRRTELIKALEKLQK